ncbi:uncharacterized protein VTP21DRAFT_4626 [Calcarisporiella thermophila]|uniref:uncharacterized protein n=1 Tax=Calcarisporiella thermophila TaxID=911321 RepID=UPI0037427CBF
METESRTFSWQEHLIKQLEARDVKEKLLSIIVEDYTMLTKRAQVWTARNAEIEAELKSLRHENEKLLTELKSLREIGSPENLKRITELEGQVASLKEERAELYKTQGQNAQRLVDMNDAIRNYEQREKQNGAQISTLTEQYKALSKQNEQQKELLREKDGLIQILQDELAALHLELLKKEERLKTVEAENGQLVRRWLKKMNDEAEKMNEANRIYEGTIEAQQRSSPPSGSWTNKLWGKGSKTLHTRSMSMSAVPELKDGRTETHRGSVLFAQAQLPNSASIRFCAHDAEINTVQTSSDGTLFATGSSDKKIKIFNSKTGELITTLTGSMQSVMCVAFNSTDELVIGASNDTACRLWHIGSGRIRHTLTGHIGKVYSARFTSDTTKVITGSHDRTIKVWDLHKGYCTRTIFTYSSCNDVCLMDSDGSTIISGHLDNNVRFWDIRTGNCIKELSGIHSSQITSVYVTPDGSKLLTNSRDNSLKVVDLRTYGVVKTLQADGYTTGLNWSRACTSPDGKYASAGSMDGTLFVWNILNGQVERSLKEHAACVVGVSWSPQGERIFSADKDRSICIWAAT